MTEQPVLKPGSRQYWWKIVKILIGLIVWLIIVLVTYLTLYTIPAIVLGGFLLVLMIFQLLRPPRPTRRTFRPEEEDPRRAVQPDQIDMERVAK